MNMSKTREIFILITSFFSVAAALLSLWSKSIGVGIVLLTTFSVFIAIIGFILNISLQSLFRPIYAIYIALIVIGMGLVFTTYLYRVFPNFNRNISEFEYFFWDNEFSWKIIYAIITGILAVLLGFISRAIVPHAQRFRDLCLRQKFNLLALLILFLGAFFRVLVHFDLN